MTPFLIFPSLCLCSIAVLFCTSELKETWQGFEYCIRTTFVDKPTDSRANPNAQSCEHSRFSYLMRWHFSQPCFLQDSNRCQARLLLTSGPHVHSIFTVSSICLASHCQLLFTECTPTQATGVWCVWCVFVRTRCRSWTGGWQPSTAGWGSPSWAGNTLRSPTRSCWALHRYHFNTHSHLWGVQCRMWTPWFTFCS